MRDQGDNKDIQAEDRVIVAGNMPPYGILSQRVSLSRRETCPPGGLGEHVN